MDEFNFFLIILALRLSFVNRSFKKIGVSIIDFVQSVFNAVHELYHPLAIRGGRLRFLALTHDDAVDKINFAFSSVLNVF